MKHFDYRFFSFLSLLLLFGLVVDGYGQVTRDCFSGCNQVNNNPDAQNQPPNALIITTVNFTNSLGQPIDLNTCPDPNDIWITVGYRNTSNNQTRINVFFQSTFEARLNVGDEAGSTRFGNLDFLLGNLPPGNGIRTVQVQLPIPFDCQKETGTLSQIQLNWSNPGTPNNNIACGGLNYPTGQCVRFPNTERTITVDGFLYDFGVAESCFEEDNLTFRNFFLTNVAGGNGVFDITWTITKNGTNRTVGPLRFPQGLFISEPAFPNDEIVVSVIVRDSNGLTMTVPPDAIRSDIPLPFEVNIQTFPNVGDVTPSPNGSIRLSNFDPNIGFNFRWEDINGPVSPDDERFADPTNVIGLGEGTYFLYMTDENGVERCFSRTITFQPLPVIYANLSLNFKPPSRSVNFSWSTTKEWEASHFEVERAVSERNFEKIGEVKAAGWSDQLTEYLFEDKMLPLTGGNLLYRLKQVDFNGDFEYSKVLSVRVPGMQFTSGVWRAFPNPTDGSTLRISLLDASQYNNEPLIFRLIHPTSQTEAISVASEKEMNDVLADLSKSMPKGVFVVEIQWGQKVEHIKVIKK